MSNEQSKLYPYKIRYGLSNTGDPNDIIEQVVDAPSEMDAEIYAYHLAYERYVRPIRDSLISSAEPFIENGS